jgi:predicted ribosome quality control (RQC) complex YloA/Tae2 family protein
MTVLPYLSGAIVQKVERLAPECVLLSIREPGRTAQVIVLGGSKPIVGEIDRPSGKTAADAAIMRMRKLLEGGRVVGVSSHRILVRRGDERVALIAAPNGVVLQEQAELAEVAEAPIDARGAFAEYLAERAAQRRRLLIAAIEAQRKKLLRRLEAIAGDLAKIARADEWQAQGTLLITNQHAIARGSASVTIDDWSSGEAKPVTIALDPSKSAKENADALFHRARRMKKGHAIAEQRRVSTEKAIASLDRLRDVEDLDLLEERARALGIKPQKPGAAARVSERLPFHKFQSHDHEILVGRGAKDNDDLTRAAKPHHLWLHTKNITGAHVIVPLDKNESCPSEVLVDAAHLAAHFSDARGETIVEVQYTPRKYVRKPKGSAPGAVIVDREKVLVLRVEPQRIDRLIKPVE